MRSDRLLEALPAVVAVSVIGLGFVALGLGYSWFWVVWVAGLVSLVPLSAILADALVGPEAAPEGEAEDALALLRERYARGELDEDEFERLVDGLLDTETVEGARDRVGRRADPADRDADLETERA